MSRKYRVWLDSGANIHSKYETEVCLANIGYTDEEWDALTEGEQEDEMREVAFRRMDWGYEPIE